MEIKMKRAEAAVRAAQIYEKLMALPRPDNLSNNVWAFRAGVNSSFFVNMRKGSEPSVASLRKVLNVVGVSLSEFFADESEGRMIAAPDVEFLSELLETLLANAPRRQDRRAAFLAEALSQALALPSNLRAKTSIPDSTDEAEQGSHSEARSATS
jgi:transcriptional regulator with XRE-family HTH domain